jgi:hypothetical protein
MKIGLHDSDKTNFPNLALMKLSAYHKAKGDAVEWYFDLAEHTYDKIYSSKVFMFTPDEDISLNAIKGGTGYDINSKLSKEIEHTRPDYTLYDIDYSVGFVTRGCIRNCSFCVVPKKEGKIQPHADIDEFLAHNKLVLLDNNILSHDHGIKQLTKIAKEKIKLDVNQGVDARFIDDLTAKILSKIKWLKPLRLACDSQETIEHIRQAVKCLRYNNVTPSGYFCYCLITNDIDESLERVKELKSLNLTVFAQPFIDCFKASKITQVQRDLSRWVNHKAIFNSCTFEEYKYNRKD